MKPETTRMLEEWRSSELQPMKGLSIKRDYCPDDDGNIELTWYPEFIKNGEKQTLKAIVKNVADDIDSLNIMIDHVENNQLKELVKQSL